MLPSFVGLLCVFSVRYFLNVVEEFRSCLSKPEGFLGFTIKVAIVHVAV